MLLLNNNIPLRSIFPNLLYKQSDDGEEFRQIISTIPVTWMVNRYLSSNAPYNPDNIRRMVFSDFLGDGFITDAHYYPFTADPLKRLLVGEVDALTNFSAQMFVMDADAHGLTSRNKTDFAEAVFSLACADIPPNLVLKTKGGMHLFYFVEEITDPQEYATKRQALLKKIAPRKVKDVNRGVSKEIYKFRQFTDIKLTDIECKDIGINVNQFDYLDYYNVDRLPAWNHEFRCPRVLREDGTNMRNAMVWGLHTNIIGVSKLKVPVPKDVPIKVVVNKARADINLPAVNRWDAVSAYVADYPLDKEYISGKCPVCGGETGFKVLPQKDNFLPSWYCHHDSHIGMDVGGIAKVSGKRRGTIVDLHAYEAGVPPEDFLIEKGYLLQVSSKRRR